MSGRVPDASRAERIYRSLRRDIAEGRLEVGDPLPPVRAVARKAGVNLNTVARVYRRLAAEGLLVSARGRGTRVIAVRQRRRMRKGEFRERVRDLLADAVLGGLSR